MGYSIYALVARQEILQSIAEEHAEAMVIPLQQKLAMIPNTDTFYDAIRRKMPGVLIDKPSAKLWRLTTSLLTVASYASTQGPIAYIEADYSDGKGSQGSIVWKNKKILYGPAYEGIGSLPDTEQLREMPINTALRIIGAERGRRKDAFDALGLGAHDNLNEWISAMQDTPRDTSRRLVNLYPLSTKVEILASDGLWLAAKVIRHEHPGLWVQTKDNAQWFVTNGGHIRGSNG